MSILLITNLRRDDCHIVREKFQYPKFDEYTYPSADLQISAESVEAVARGEYKWLLAELHPAPALLQHCMYWACPDKPALNDALIRTTLNKPSFHYGLFVADFTAHTSVHFFDALPTLTNFVAPQRANPDWLTIAPADAEVYVDETSGDVCLRKIGTRRIPRFVCARVGDPARLSSLSFRPRAAHAAVALRPRDCATADVGRGPGGIGRRKLQRRLARSRPGRRTFARAKGVATLCLHSSDRASAAPQRRGRAATKIPSRFLSISRAICFWKFSIAG